MQASVKKISPKDRRTNGKGTQKRGLHLRSRISPAGITRLKRPGFNFLKQVFTPVPIKEVDPLLSEDNYEYLYQTVKNYSKLLGSSFRLKRKYGKFMELKHALEDKLPEGQYARFHYGLEHIHIELYFGRDYLDYSMYLIPVGILNQTEGKLRDILLAFFSLLKKNQHFDLITSTAFHDFEISNYEDWVDDEDEELKHLYAAYFDGYIYDTLDLILVPLKTISDLQCMIRGYVPKNPLEEKLIGCIRESYPFLRGKSALSFAEIDWRIFTPDELSDEARYEMIDAPQLLLFVHGINDNLSDSYAEFISERAGEYGSETIQRESKIITPSTKGLFKAGYLEKFFRWLDKLITILNEYEI